MNCHLKQYIRMQMTEQLEVMTENKKICQSSCWESTYSKGEIQISERAQKTNLGQEKQIQIDSKKLWTVQEVDLLENLYYKHGPAWSDFKKMFVKKSANDQKNKVNNSIRRVCSLLDAKGFSRMSYKSDTNHKIQSMLNMCFQVDQHMNEMQITPNPDSMLQSFKAKLLRLCFCPEPQEEDIQSLLKTIRNLNIRLKCFGNFKAKNQKRWKLSPQTFRAILLFDKPFIEKDFEAQTKKSSRVSPIILKESSSTDFNIEGPIIERETDILPALDENFYLSQQKKHESTCLERQYCQITGLEFVPSYASFQNLIDSYES